MFPYSLILLNYQIIFELHFTKLHLIHCNITDMYIPIQQVYKSLQYTLLPPYKELQTTYKLATNPLFICKAEITYIKFSSIFSKCDLPILISSKHFAINFIKAFKRLLVRMPISIVFSAGNNRNIR